MSLGSCRFELSITTASPDVMRQMWGDRVMCGPLSSLLCSRINKNECTRRILCRQNPLSAEFDWDSFPAKMAQGFWANSRNSNQRIPGN